MTMKPSNIPVITEIGQGQDSSDESFADMFKRRSALHATSIEESKGEQVETDSVSNSETSKITSMIK